MKVSVTDIPPKHCALCMMRLIAAIPIGSAFQTMCAGGHSCIVYTNKALGAPERDPQEEEKVRNWIINARQDGGGFVSAFADACIRADNLNWEMLREIAFLMREKYPEYNSTRDITPL